MVHTLAPTRSYRCAVSDPDGGGLTGAQRTDVRHDEAVPPGRGLPASLAHPDDPGAVLTLVQAALDSGDTALLEEAYAVLRCAMSRLLAHPGRRDSHPPQPDGCGRTGLPDSTLRRVTRRWADRPTAP